MLINKIATIIVSMLYIFIFAVSFINAIAPKWYWQTFESWKAKKEPTKGYYIAKRISGIIGMLIIAAAALAPTLISYIVK